MAMRLLTGLVLAAIFFLMLCVGSVLQAVVFTLGGLWAVHEMTLLLRRKGYRPFVAPAYAFTVLLALWIFFLPNLHWYILLSLCAVVVMVELVLNKNRAVPDCLAALILFIYPLPLLAILMQMGNTLGPIALLLTFACPLVGDTFGYIFGSLLGRHKLCPAISPKKTVEGGVASLFGSMLAGLGVYFAQPLAGEAVITSAVPFLLTGFFCGFVGQAGDLFASSLKRWADVKDFSNIFPGHGGLLDRVDSVLLCAPVVYAGITLAHMWCV